MIQKVQKNTFSSCFGCGQKNPHGLHLDFSFSEDSCFTRCSIPGHFCGLEGIVHGGIIAAILDEVAAWTNFVLFKRPAITLEVNVRYLKPVPTETEILAEGRVVEQDEKNSIIKSVIRSVDGVVLAECQSKWLFPSYASLAKIAGIDEPALREMFTQMLESLQ
ncbi:MAG: PaaI family thioesterase [Candidatus Hodarchaeales archaeon]|jgi:uncharacterized protein (TIGR00369 family)